MRGVRGTSLIGVVRAPVAIINFASSACKDLWLYIRFNKEPPEFLKILLGLRN